MNHRNHPHNRFSSDSLTTLSPPPSVSSISPIPSTSSISPRPNISNISPAPSASSIAHFSAMVDSGLSAVSGLGTHLGGHSPIPYRNLKLRPVDSKTPTPTL